MHKLTLPALFAVLASGVAVPAMAQTMVGDQTLSEADRPSAVAQCASLKAQAETGSDAMGPTSATTTAATATASTEGSEKAADDGSTGSGHDAMEEGATDGAPAAFDVTRLTIEDCQAAGLLDSQ
ncbi:hypothetical protein KTN05_03240 [Paracoccus sp. Z118]|uniref:hypothetical protein n=1 Tax=Paracoccus sp. Z118 TaxID=2851017 RepID=UPI001C2C847D|nr:hypothetical protein [Paracoccus sp. Z118]MBV0890861.1 hypothetical protein [Paracoccus sp. Z118]